MVKLCKQENGSVKPKLKLSPFTEPQINITNVMDGPDPPPPPRPLIEIEFLRNTGPGPIENHKATKPTFNV